MTTTHLVKRDGEILAHVDTENDAFAWILNHQGQSVDYATRYGGYEIVPVEHRLICRAHDTELADDGTCTTTHPTTGGYTWHRPDPRDVLEITI